MLFRRWIEVMCWAYFRADKQEGPLAAGDNQGVWFKFHNSIR